MSESKKVIDDFDGDVMNVVGLDGDFVNKVLRGETAIDYDNLFLNDKEIKERKTNTSYEIFCRRQRARQSSKIYNQHFRKRK